MNYFELTGEQIYNNKEILKNFLSLYSEKTGEKKINAGCVSCINNYQKKLFNLMEAQNKNYVFNEKYDGMFFKNDYITNSKLTDEIAKEILEHYNEEPISERFAKYPLEALETETLEKISKRKNKKELNESDAL